MKLIASACVVLTVVGVLAGCSSSPVTPTNSPNPSVGNLDDPLCSAAQDSVDVSNSLASRTGDLTAMLQDPTFLTSNDATKLNAWGDDMLTLANKTLTFYKVGVTETKGEDVNADFTALVDFVTNYTLALAQEASDAKTPAAFWTKVQGTFSDPDVQTDTKAMPAAASGISAYIQTRCGVVG